MFSLKSDEMTAFRANDSMTFTFYVTFSNSIPNWTTCVKEVFLARAPRSISRFVTVCVCMCVCVYVCVCVCVYVCNKF